MSSDLCSVCQSIPPRIWSHSYNLMENSREIYVQLQCLGDMERAKTKGCQLCTILLDSPEFRRDYNAREYKLPGKKEMMYLRRSLGFPDRAVELGMGHKGSQTFSRTFFYRMPAEWCAYTPAQMLRTQEMLRISHQSVNMLISLGHMDRGNKRLHVKSTNFLVPKPMHINGIVNNIELMKNWLRVCTKIHTECSKQQPSFLPTRLLDVEAFSVGEDVRLVTSKSMKSDVCTPPTYLTLSHCWGKASLITTTTENIKSMETRISFSSLSQTFRDAVALTRKLGKRYLWIDSLCIIQNDTEDWAKEAADMAKVYGNSYCTLAALSSVDGSGGCHLEVRVQKVVDNTFFDLQDPSSADEPYIRVFRKEPVDWTTDYDGLERRSGETQSPLRFRAWVLQERELSKRSIHFGTNQLLWECKQMRGSAQLPWLEMKKKKGLTYPQGWLQLVEDYSLRALTKSEDKLPALAGIAETYQRQHAQYLAGLWSDQFPAALMWQSLDPYAKRHGVYRAPTWSWASLQGRVSYDTQRLVPPCEDYPDPRDNRPRMLDNVYKGLKLYQAVVQPTRCDHIYGGIEGAYLILEGASLLEIDLPRQESTPEERIPRRDSEPLVKDRKQIGVFYRDSVEDVISAKTAFLLVLQNEPLFPLSDHPVRLHQAKNMVDSVMGIVVVSDERHGGSFRRLGLGRWVDQDLLARSKPQTLKLV